MIVRPKTGTVLMFMCPGGVGCSIGAYHQQRWDAEPDGDNFRVTNKNVTVIISKADFEETFKEVPDVGKT